MYVLLYVHIAMLRLPSKVRPWLVNRPFRLRSRLLLRQIERYHRHTTDHLHPIEFGIGYRKGNGGFYLNEKQNYQHQDSPHTPPSSRLSWLSFFLSFPLRNIPRLSLHA